VPDAPTPALKVRDENTSPPGGWHCVVAETGRRFSDPVFSAIVEAVSEHLLAHGLDPAEAPARVHHATARVLIAQGHRDLIERVAEAVPRSVVHYAQGAAARVLLWWKDSPIAGLIRGKFDRGESPFVEQSEADRRAAICADCKFNRVPTGKGWVRNWTDRKMLDCVDGRQTASHDDLGVCKACGGCELRAACWWPADILRAVTPKGDAHKYPDHCWKRELLA